MSTGFAFHGIRKGLTSALRRVKPRTKSDWALVAGGTALGVGVGTTVVHDRNTNNRDMRNLHYMLMPTPDPRNQEEDKEELLRILNRQTNVTIPGMPLLTPRLNNYSNIQNVRTIGNRKLFEADRNGVTQTFVIGSDPDNGSGRIGVGTLVNLNDYWQHRQNGQLNHEDALRRSSLLGNGQGRNFINRLLISDRTQMRGDIALQFVNGNVNIGLDSSMRQSNLDTVSKPFENITLNNGQSLPDFLQKHADPFQVTWRGTPTDLAVASFLQNGTRGRTTARFNPNGSLTLFKTDAQGHFLGEIEQIPPQNVKSRLESLMTTHTPVARPAG